MTTSSQKTPKIVELASSLERDILDKRLVSGDPYLSTANAARLLGVSTVAANRALQLLVKRDILSRRQRSGTFIADRKDGSNATSIERVHLLVHKNFLKSEGVLADGVILGIQEKLPHTDIQFNFLPTDDESPYTNRIISEVLNSPRVQGLVLVRAPLQVQRIVQSSGLPAVIYGTPFPSITSVPWIDRDHYHAGRLAAARLIRQGFRRLTVLTREKPMPGDYRMLDGVRDEMSALQLPICHIAWRSLPSDTEAVRYAVTDLLKDNKHGQGFICRSRPLADGALEAIAAGGLNLGTDAGIVLLDVYQADARPTLPFHFIMPAMSPEITGQHIGNFLILQSQGIKPIPDCELIPIELREGAALANV
ncbi:MAG: GntR family transcriptional regulator [Planctomycetota bacterium]|nr:GntR family transcriptional regulator [Planctomycetota bacterium]